MVSKYFITSMLIMTLASGANAQFRLPSFEIAAKGGYLYASDNIENSDGNSLQNDYESVYAQGEISVHFGQHIALGYYYQKSVFGNYHGSNGSGSSNIDQDGEHLIHGLNLRFSTGRAAKFRPYIQAKYFSHQFVVHYNGFNLATEGSGAAAGVGLMLRFGHNLYLNIVEAEVNMFIGTNEVLFAKQDLFPIVRTGLTYNFSKKK
jgi:hypothetical protein